MKFTTFKVGEPDEFFTAASFPVFRSVDERWGISRPVDAEGYQVVNADGGDMGRAGPDGIALKHFSDGRWLVVIEGKTGEDIGEMVATLPVGYRIYGEELGFPAYHGLYGPSGGLESRFVAYLVYDQKPEVEGG